MRVGTLGEHLRRASRVWVRLSRWWRAWEGMEDGDLVGGDDEKEKSSSL